MTQNSERTKTHLEIWKVFDVLTSSAQKHLMVAELVSGGSFVNSGLATEQTCRNSPCQKLALLFLFSTVDMLVPEISVPNKITLVLCSPASGRGEVKREASDSDLVWAGTAPLAKSTRVASCVAWFRDGLRTTPLLLLQKPPPRTSQRRKLLRFLARNALEAQEGLNEDVRSTSSFPN